MMENMNNIISSSSSSSSNEVDDESARNVTEKKLYVALGRDFEEGKSVLSWALHNSGDFKLCLLHVHQPTQMAGYSTKVLKEQEALQMIFDKYLLICNQVGVQAEKLHIVRKSIRKGIVEIITLHGIRNLVMGAVANKHYFRKMTGLKSEKAIYVNVNAPVTCKISFVCKGELIYTRERSFDRFNEDVTSKLQHPIPDQETRQLSPLLARLGHNKPTHNFHRANSVNFDIHLRRVSKFYPPDSPKASPSKSSDLSICSFADSIPQLKDDTTQTSHHMLKESDELPKERDDALTKATGQKQGETSGRNLPHNLLDFSVSEIEEATRFFHPSLKIGEGEHVSIYKGLLCYTHVFIKKFQSHTLQGSLEYQHEVDTLSKLRHPNLITLIGSCPELGALIYEYTPNGSLEDRLICKDNTPPLSWQTRIRIMAELCSVLGFFHSIKPHSIVHGNINPENILLDANLVIKVSDFRSKFTSSAYTDPEFDETGVLTTKSDTYSFGIILLRLLTGRADFGIAKEVKYALAIKTFGSLLDISAGDWPYIQAQQLAYLALWCADTNSKKRANVGPDIWKVLDTMRASCKGPSYAVRLCSEELNPAPSYFLCPIFQEVMKDPQVAADGFTYEAEALRGWLESGHITSPMTNLELLHTSLVPNLALRSAIQEWLQQQN